MPYFVTFDDPSGAAAIDDLRSRPFELADALAHACRLLDDNKRNVTIRDDRDNSIAGDDLVACCGGDKQLTPELRAISN